MKGIRHILAFGSLGAAAIVFATGMRSSSKPDSEQAYFRELSRLNAVDKPQALQLARQGDGWYGATGANAEARKAMAITLLVDLGDMEQARRETRAFIAAYPQSSYRPLVQGVTGIHPRPSGPRPAP
jgi:hypothetical protein